MMVTSGNSKWREIVFTFVSMGNSQGGKLCMYWSHQICKLRISIKRQMLWCNLDWHGTEFCSPLLALKGAACWYQSHATSHAITQPVKSLLNVVLQVSGIYNKQRQENCEKWNLNGLVSIARANKVVPRLSRYVGSLSNDDSVTSHLLTFH